MLGFGGFRSKVSRFTASGCEFGFHGLSYPVLQGHEPSGMLVNVFTNIGASKTGIGFWGHYTIYNYSKEHPK